MSPFAEFPLLTIFVILVLVVVLTSVFAPRKGGPPRQTGGGAAKRTCRACGTEHPPHATFCRNCGGGL